MTPLSQTEYDTLIAKANAVVDQNAADIKNAVSSIVNGNAADIKAALKAEASKLLVISPTPVPTPPPPTTGTVLRRVVFRDFADVGAVLTAAGAGNVRNPEAFSLANGLLRAQLLTNVMRDPEIEWYHPASVSVFIRLRRRYTPGYTTVGTRKLDEYGNPIAEACKILGAGWATADNRLTLDVTNRNQVQLSFGAKQGNTWPIPFVNSSDQGSRYTLETQFSDGRQYDWIVQYVGSTTAPKARAWIFPSDGAPTAPKLTVTGTCNGTPILVNRASTMGHLNQSPPFAAQGTDDAMIEVVTGANPWNLPGAL